MAIGSTLQLATATVAECHISVTTLLQGTFTGASAPLHFDLISDSDNESRDTLVDEPSMVNDIVRYPVSDLFVYSMPLHIISIAYNLSVRTCSQLLCDLALRPRCELEYFQDFVTFIVCPRPGGTLSCPWMRASMFLWCRGFAPTIGHSR